MRRWRCIPLRLPLNFAVSWTGIPRLSSLITPHTSNRSFSTNCEVLSFMWSYNSLFPFSVLNSGEVHSFSTPSNSGQIIQHKLTCVCDGNGSLEGTKWVYLVPRTRFGSVFLRVFSALLCEEPRPLCVSFLPSQQFRRFSLRHSTFFFLLFSKFRQQNLWALHSFSVIPRYCLFYGCFHLLCYLFCFLFAV